LHAKCAVRKSVLMKKQFSTIGLITKLKFFKLTFKSQTHRSVTEEREGTCFFSRLEIFVGAATELFLEILEFSAVEFVGEETVVKFAVNDEFTKQEPLILQEVVGILLVDKIVCRVVTSFFSVLEVILVLGCVVDVCKVKHFQNRHKIKMLHTLFIFDPVICKISGKTFL
jgi:hypothetical protein